jgi:drug/metabolite transporter (DMT)-like permease
VKQNNLAGIGFKLLNCFLFSILSLTILYCTTNLPVTQILFIRVALGVCIAAMYLMVIKKKITFQLSRKDCLFYLSRAIISFIAMQFWVYAMQHIGINEATALSYTGPFWVFLAARYMIGEAFSWSCFVAVVANMSGVIIILKPSIDFISWQGVVASLSSIFLWVLYETICKKQTTTQHYMLQSFYVCCFASFVTAPFAFFQWQPIDAQTWTVLGVSAVIGIANITSIFLAYSYAPMMVISPFSYARLVFTALLSAWFYNKFPSADVFIGSAIIMSVNFYFAYKHRDNKELVATA